MGFEGGVRNCCPWDRREYTRDTNPNRSRTTVIRKLRRAVTILLLLLNRTILRRNCYCIACRPCITHDNNRQMRWHTQQEEPHQRNSAIRKEHYNYKRFWTMLLHRGAWNDDRYLLMKTDAMSRDPRRQKYEWLKRDIMQQRCWQKYLSDMTVAKKFEYPTISPIGSYLYPDTGL